MRKHRLPQLIKYIDVRGVNKSMIEFNANLDKLNDFFSIFTGHRTKRIKRYIE